MKPILFSVGNFNLHSFGLMIATGVLISLMLMSRKARRTGFPREEHVFDLVFIVLLSGFFGARIYYALQFFSFYVENPLKIFAVWEGGLIFYGGLVGSFLGLAAYCFFRKMPLVHALDFLIPYVALTQAFGRLGCFLNGCCYGKVCDLPWGVLFPGHGHPVHPTQLYEAVYVGVLFLFLNKRYDRQKFSGETASLYFLFYAVGRFFLEGVRADNPMIGAFTWNQWLSLLIMSAALLFYVKRRKHASV